jgi:SAM-dependent methyltransferase
MRANEYPLTLSDTERARYQLMAEEARANEAELWRAAGIVAGAHVADVGCGPGALLPAWADAVGPSGLVVGVDADPGAVAAARALVAASGLKRVSVRQGPADHTGLPAAAFDTVVLRHVLAHNGRREDAIVAHLATLLHPGGSLYLVDADVTAFRIVPEDPELADLNGRYLAFQTARGNDMRAGLRLRERIQRAGLDLVEYRGSYVIRPVPQGLRGPAWAAREALVAGGVATEQDLNRWDLAFQRLDAHPTRPTLFAPVFVAIGRSGSADTS